MLGGDADITEFLDVPVADGNGVVDLAKATVKEEIVTETMDPKSAVAGLLALPIELARSVGPFVPREGNVHLLGANIRYAADAKTLATRTCYRIVKLFDKIRGDNSNGILAAISRCGVGAIGTAL